MMDLTQYNNALGKVVKDLKSGPGAEIMVKIAISGFTLLRQRVQETGIDAKGTKFRPYSTKPTLVGSSTFSLQKKLQNSIFSTKEKRKEYEWRTVNGHHLAILKGGYKEIREKLGRQTDHVDFVVTGRMWANIMAQNPKKSDLLSTDADHVRGIAIIGAKEETEKLKLAGNTKRRGDILDLSAKEIEDLKLTYNIGVLKIFKENGL